MKYCTLCAAFKTVTISSLNLNVLNIYFFLYVVIACFLHIIKMMTLEGKLLEIQKPYIPIQCPCKNQRTHSLEELKEAEGSLPAPQGVGTGRAPEGYVNTQYEATGDTNLFFDLFYFNSKHRCEQSKKTSHTLVILSSPPISKSSWILPKCGSFFLRCLSAMALWTEIKQTEKQISVPLLCLQFYIILQS